MLFIELQRTYILVPTFVVDNKYVIIFASARWCRCLIEITLLASTSSVLILGDLD